MDLPRRDRAATGAPGAAGPSTWGAIVASSLRDGMRGALIVLVVGSAAVLFFVLATLIVLRFVDPPGSALMARQHLNGVNVRHTWVPIERVSRNVLRAVVNSEDARFCRHHGIDFVEFRHALRRAKRNEGLAVRGASTISMQVVKNLFLWPDQSYLRKGLELLITPLMELVWPKQRILEVYLNIAEWGPGIFGVEAASRHHFKRPASRVSRSQASLLAAALPNPIVRKAGRPGPKTRRRATKIRRQVRKTRIDLSCLSLA